MQCFIKNMRQENRIWKLIKYWGRMKEQNKHTWKLFSRKEKTKGDSDLARDWAAKLIRILYKIISEHEIGPWKTRWWKCFEVRWKRKMHRNLAHLNKCFYWSQQKRTVTLRLMFMSSVWARLTQLKINKTVREDHGVPFHRGNAKNETT